MERNEPYQFDDILVLFCLLAVLEGPRREQELAKCGNAIVKLIA